MIAATMTMKEIRKYAKAGDYEAMEAMARSKRVSERERETYCQLLGIDYAVLTEGIRKLVVVGATCVASPFAGDGVLSQGTVKAPVVDTIQAQSEEPLKKAA